MNYFPAYMNIKGKRVVICGGGRHAVQRIKKLIPFGAELCVVSEKPCEEIYSYSNVKIHLHRFCENDLFPLPVFLIAAEDDEENSRIVEICRRHHVAVNAVDQPTECDFIFPSMFATEHMCVSVCTGGESPTAGMVLRDMFSELCPDDIDETITVLKKLKEKMKEENTDKSEIKEKLRELAEKRINSKHKN